MIYFTIITRTTTAIAILRYCLYEGNDGSFWPVIGLILSSVAFTVNSGRTASSSISMSEQSHR